MCNDNRQATRRVRGALAALRALLAGALFAVGLAGCALIDLRGFPITTMPGGTNTVLESVSNVWVEFPEAVVESVVQPLLSLTAGGQSVEGDMSWAGNRLLFTPIEALKPGVRYVLQLRGTVETVKGRSFDEDIVVPFFVGSDAEPPIVSAALPANGETVAVGQSLELTFSKAMDQTSFPDTFSLSPSTDFNVAWSSDGTVATVTPVDRWTSETLYSWTLTVDCKAKDGVALPRQWSGSFLVQPTTTLPSVVSTEPAIVSGASVTPLTGGLSALLSGEAILMDFSVEVDLTSLQSAFSLSPTVAGALQRITATEVAFVPSGDWQMDQEYLLQIAAELTDLSGDKMRAPYRETFTPAIPHQAVSEIDLSGDLTPPPALPWVYLPADFNNASAYSLSWVSSATAPNPQLTVTITFSQPYNNARKAVIASAISFNAIFGATTNPSVLQISWTNDQTVAISLGPFERSSPTQSNYYELTIPAGTEASMNQNGSYLKDAVKLLFNSGT